MKAKTHSGMKKRIRVTGTGKFMYQKASKRHLLINKSKRQKKLDTNPLGIHAADAKNVAKMLPGK